MRTSNLSVSNRLSDIRMLVTWLCLCGLGLSHSALAATRPIQNPGKQVLASSSTDSVRFSSLGELLQLRLEVINSAGEVLFDSGFKSGNILDWPLADRQGQRLADNTYLCVVTVKDSSGQMTRKAALAKLGEQGVSLQPAARSSLSAVQVETANLGLEEEGGLTILEAGGSAASSVLAHDGNTAHLVSGRGGLTFSSGDFFANQLLEQMRLTAEGNLGIGTNNPQARLDVAGTIRASGGIVFPDGSIQYSASSKTFGAKSARPDQQAIGGENLAPNASGTGTQNRIARWTDNAGTLGDANIYELNGSIGINAPPDPTFRLDVLGHNRFRGSNVSFYLTGTKPTGNEWVFQTVDADGRLRIFGQDQTTGSERLSIGLNGNVGIGATTPTARLDVAGDVNTSTQYNIGGSRVLSIQGNSNTTVGLQTGITGSNNSFFGAAAGSNNSAGFQNSYFGVSAGRENLSGAANAFFGYDAGRFTGGSANTFVGKAAGLGNTTGSNNTFIGSDANPTSTSLTFATAIGSGALATTSNTVTLGRNLDTVQIPGALTVAGTVQNTSGGFKFPDGSVQTVAAANTVYTTTTPNQTTEITHTWPTDPATTIVHLTLPTGIYLVTATVNFINQANYFGQDNTRSIDCFFTGDNTTQSITLPAGGSFTNGGLTMTIHSVLTITSGGIDLKCHNQQFAPNQDKVIVFGGNHLTAVKLSGNVIVQ